MENAIYCIVFMVLVDVFLKNLFFVEKMYFTLLAIPVQFKEWAG